MNNLITENQNLKPNSTDYNDAINLEPELDKLKELNNPEIVEQGGEPPKKKRGRKPKSETETSVEVPEIDLSPLLEIAIKRLPNPIPLSDIEKSLFNQSANKVFQKYSGNFKYIEELNFGLILISVIYPRIKPEKVNNEE